MEKGLLVGHKDVLANLFDGSVRESRAQVVLGPGGKLLN